MNDPWLRRLAILSIVVLVAWILWLLQPVLAPFFAAFLLAYLLNPLVEKLMLWGRLPRWTAILTVFGAIGAVMVAVLWVMVPLIWDQLLYAKDHVPDAIHWINTTLRNWLRETFNIKTQRLNLDELTNFLITYLQHTFGVDGPNATNTANGSAPVVVAPAQTNVLAGLAKSGLNVINIAGLMVLVPIVAFYFLLDWPVMLSRLHQMLPRRFQAGTLKVVAECHEVLGAFVRGQLLVMFLLGCIYAVGLQLVGIKVGIIIGMVAGLASIIPYLGFVTGLVAAVIACLFQFGFDWVHLGLVGLVFFIGQLMEGYVLQPYLLGDKIGLPPVAVIFAVLAGAQLLGFAGMLLALPLAAVLAVLMRRAYDTYAGSLYYTFVPVPVVTEDAGGEPVANTEMALLPRNAPPEALPQFDEPTSPAADAANEAEHKP